MGPMRFEPLAAAMLAAASFAAAAGEPEPPRADGAPNDPLFEMQWPFANREGTGDVAALEAWRFTRGSPDIVVAVLDDGVQLDHPDLAANIARPGRNFGDGAPLGDGGPLTAADRHGTAVAGIVAARGDNGLGISGICPLCRLLPVRVEGASNEGLAAAFRYAAEQGADVITNSWGYHAKRRLAADAALGREIRRVTEQGRGGRGVLVVFATSNDAVDVCSGEDADISALPSVLAVGVANHRDELGGSGYGECLDLVAGSKPERRSTIGVPTTDRTGLDGNDAGDYQLEFGGTSAAAPLVAGIAGLLLSLNPELTRAQLQGILEHTADKVDPARAAYDAAGLSARAGYGRVNAGRALAPAATIEIAPAVVAPGEPFAITVTGSAPYGLAALSWRGHGTGGLDGAHVAGLDGQPLHAITWSGLAIAVPGVYAFTPDAVTRAPTAMPDGYPQRASAREPTPSAWLTVVERLDAVSR